MSSWGDLARASSAGVRGRRQEDERMEEKRSRAPAAAAAAAEGPHRLGRSDSLEKYGDRFPTVNNIVNGGDDNNLQNMLDNDHDSVPLEDDSIDELTLADELGIVEKVGPIEYVERLLLMRSMLDISSAELGINTTISMLPESSRDCRYSGDLYWHGYYQMNQVSPTSLPPMRYTRCESSTEPRCFHEPRAMLQIFCIKLKSYLQDAGSPLEVYGFIAVRDAEDYRRNYLFNRSRDNPATVNQISDYLTLMSPRRGISMTIDCLLEVDLRVKGAIEDVTLVDGCSDFIEGRGLYDTECEGTMDDTNGTAIFDHVVFRRAVEATIELAFMKVPAAGFEVKMCGYTAISESLYSFIGEQCDCNSFITSAGKYPEYFIAAVPFDDTIFIDFMEGKMSVPFKAASVHGSQEKEYHFHNGATVRVKVSWSTTYY